MLYNRQLVIQKQLCCQQKLNAETTRRQMQNKNLVLMHSKNVDSLLGI